MEGLGATYNSVISLNPVAGGSGAAGFKKTDHGKFTKTPGLKAWRQE